MTRTTTIRAGTLFLDGIGELPSGDDAGRVSTGVGLIQRWGEILPQSGGFVGDPDLGRDRPRRVRGRRPYPIGWSRRWRTGGPERGGPERRGRHRLHLRRELVQWRDPSRVQLG